MPARQSSKETAEVAEHASRLFEQLIRVQAKEKVEHSAEIQSSIRAVPQSVRRKLLSLSEQVEQLQHTAEKELYQLEILLMELTQALDDFSVKAGLRYFCHLLPRIVTQKQWKEIKDQHREQRLDAPSPLWMTLVMHAGHNSEQLTDEDEERLWQAALTREEAEDRHAYTFAEAWENHSDTLAASDKKLRALVREGTLSLQPSEDSGLADAEFHRLASRYADGTLLPPDSDLWRLYAVAEIPTRQLYEADFDNVRDFVEGFPDIGALSVAVLEPRFTSFLEDEKGFFKYDNLFEFLKQVQPHPSRFETIQGETNLKPIELIRLMYHSLDQKAESFLGVYGLLRAIGEGMRVTLADGVESELDRVAHKIQYFNAVVETLVAYHARYSNRREEFGLPERDILKLPELDTDRELHELNLPTLKLEKLEPPSSTADSIRQIICRSDSPDDWWAAVVDEYDDWYSERVKRGDSSMQERGTDE